MFFPKISQETLDREAAVRAAVKKKEPDAMYTCGLGFETIKYKYIILAENFFGAEYNTVEPEKIADYLAAVISQQN